MCEWLDSSCMSNLGTRMLALTKGMTLDNNNSKNKDNSEAHFLDQYSNAVYKIFSRVKTREL